MWSGIFYFCFSYALCFLSWIFTFHFFSIRRVWTFSLITWKFNQILIFMIFNFSWALILIYYTSLIKNVERGVLIWEGRAADLSTEINSIEIYYFPFLFIFILITLLSILFCLSYNRSEASSFIFYCLVINGAGAGIFLSNSIVLFFLAYEILLLPSFFILYRFAKTRRCIEAAYLMFFWTQFGALFLLLSFLYLILLSNSTSFSNLAGIDLSRFEINFLLFSWFVGFGVKLPIWPFYGWLPKAHVEASTNFSIFLSGVLVKIAFFGLFRCLIEIGTEPTLIAIYPFLVVGVADAVFKMFYQVDLKKLVAYSTVVEMHWLTICFLSGNSPLLLAGFCMLISHALLSSNSFLLVDAINRRFKTRLITEISGINFLCPKLFLVSLVNLLLFLGFPGSIFFIAEMLFFTFLLDFMPIVTLLLLPLLYLFGPTFFFRSWSNVLFGNSRNSTQHLRTDLNGIELISCFGLEILLIWLGLSWQFFIL